MLMDIPQPPPIRPQITHRQRLRFVLSSNASQKNISFANLLDCMLVATTATQGYDIFDAVRVNSVEIWSLSAGLATPVSVAISFPGGTTGGAGDALAYSDTSVGESCAHLHVRPQKQSAAGFWQGSGAFVAFQLTVPAQSVIDVDVSFRNTVVAPVAAANALVGATTGQFYFRGLDGLPSASTIFAPQTNGPDVI